MHYIKVNWPCKVINRFKLGYDYFQDITYEKTSDNLCGYTTEEVQALLEKVGMSSWFEQIKEYYGGYSFNIRNPQESPIIFNPFDINQFVATKCNKIE